MGDLPVVGNLFKSENRSRKKTNLMVFLRPVVVRDAADADAVTAGRYDTLRGVQQTVQPTPNAMMPSVNGAPVLPALAVKDRSATPTNNITTDTQPVTDKKP